ncbi:MAG: carboxypeptidase regulatory-like domain-containing protein [Bacteroidota bacterium]
MNRFFSLCLFALLLAATGCDSGSEDDTVTVNGTITNATGLGVDDATVTFSADGTAGRGSAENATTDTDGNFSIEVPDGSYTVTVTAPGYTATTSTITTGGEDLVTTLRGPSNLSGRIVNSQNGQALANARVSFTRGTGAAVDTSEAAIDLEVVTDADGAFSISGAPTGTYLCVVRADGFVPTLLPDVTFEDGETNLGDATAVEQPPAGAYRIVLSWGAAPRDLDSHLTGPDGQGERFHVYYLNRSDELADLDTDDTSGFGPETITLRPDNDGMYRYSVYNFSEQSLSGSQGIAGEIENSAAARVQVYTEDGLVRDYRAPASAPGDTWRVFELNASGGTGTLTDVNQYVDASGSGDIGTFRSAPKTP